MWAFYAIAFRLMRLTTASLSDFETLAAFIAVLDGHYFPCSILGSKKHPSLTGFARQVAGLWVQRIFP
jgi:hypothetical protein